MRKTLAVHGQCEKTNAFFTLISFQHKYGVLPKHSNKTHIKLISYDGDYSVQNYIVSDRCYFEPLSFSIRRTDYPIRHDFVQFVNRYWILWSEMTPDVVKGADAKTNSIKLAKHILGDRDW